MRILEIGCKMGLTGVGRCGKVLLTVINHKIGSMEPKLLDPILFCLISFCLTTLFSLLLLFIVAKLIAWHYRLESHEDNAQQ